MSPDEKHRCEDQVREAGRWSHHHPCGKPAKYHEDGKDWCGVHAPSRIRARLEKRQNNPDNIRDKIYDLKREIGWRQSNLDKLLKQLKDMGERYES